MLSRRPGDSIGNAIKSGDLSPKRENWQLCEGAGSTQMHCFQFHHFDVGSHWVCGKTNKTVNCHSVFQLFCYPLSNSQYTVLSISNQGWRQEFSLRRGLTSRAGG